VLSTTSERLTGLAHRVERLPLMTRGERPSTSRA
jgi:hypothetical protein